MTAYLGTDDVNSYIVATTPQPDMAVAPNFERFSGIEGSPELVNPASSDGAWNSGTDYGPTPRPGQLSQPLGQTYTRGPLQGTVGVIGGQPLPVRAWESADDSAATRGYTPSKTPSVQHRLGEIAELRYVHEHLVVVVPVAKRLDFAAYLQLCCISHGVPPCRFQRSSETCWLAAAVVIPPRSDVPIL